MNVSPRLVFAVLLVGLLSILVAGTGGLSAQQASTPTLKPSRTPTRTVTVVPATATLTPALATETETAAPTDTDTPALMSETPTETPTPTQTPDIPTATQGATFTPWPGAALCLDVGEFHHNGEFHTLWNAQLGCHYDHEHGQDPFTPAVAAVFPGFDLPALLGGVQIGHTNPSSPLENTAKHGGFKWDVTLSHPNGCLAGEFTDPDDVGVDAFAIEYHNFGNYAIEAEARIHSAAGLLRQCRASDPTDFGYIYVVQHQDYGQRVVPYQGTIVAYPNQPFPAYGANLSPYLSLDCVGPVIQCRASRDFVISHHANASSTWVSDPKGHNIGSELFSILFRVRDTYQLFDWNDQEHPFTFEWICSSDGGLSYAGTMPGCRWNNSTSRVHEIHGTIPVAWDNLAGFDTDARVGRITAEGYVTAYGDLTPMCLPSTDDCFPLKLVSAFVGDYDPTFGIVTPKGDFAIGNTPERDIYFCGGVVCAETDAGAAPSGWISSGN